MNQEALWTRNFLFVSLANFFFILTNVALLVTLPTASITYYGSTSSIAGLFTTIYIGAAIIIRPFMGPWIEIYGKRVLLNWSLFLFTLAAFLYSFFDAIFPLLVLRFIHGLGFGMATTITAAIIADIVPENRRGEGMGYFVLFANLGMVIGPFIGLTIFNKYGLHQLFWIVAFCSLVALLFGLMTKLPKEKRVIRSRSEKIPDLFEKSAIPIAITGAFFAIAYASVLSFMAVYAVEQGLGAQASYFFAVFVLILLITRPFTGRWFDQYGANVIVYPAIVLFAIGMLVLGLTTNAVLFFIAAAFIGAGWGTLFPSFQTIAMQNAEPNRRPVALATFFSIFDLGLGGGSLLVGAMVGVISFSTLYIFFAVYVLAGLGVYYWAQRRSTSNEKEAILE